LIAKNLQFEEIVLLYLCYKKEYTLLATYVKTFGTFNDGLLFSLERKGLINYENKSFSFRNIEFTPKGEEIVSILEGKVPIEIIVLHTTGLTKPLLLKSITKDEVKILFEEFWNTFPNKRPGIGVTMRIKRVDCLKLYTNYLINNDIKHEDIILGLRNEIKIRKDSSEGFQFMLGTYNWLLNKTWEEYLTNNETKETIERVSKRNRLYEPPS